MNQRHFVSRTMAMVRKEIMHIQRDRQVLGFALVLPLMLLLMLGYAVSFDVEHIPLIVVDQQHTAASRKLVRTFTAGALFHPVAHADARDVDELFRAGLAKAALIIPPDFDHQLNRGKTAKVQLLLDGTDNNTAQVARGYADAIIFEVTREFSQADLTRELPIEARPRTLFNPALRSSVFLVPGLIAVILVIIAVMLTALAVAREYERGSMEQLFTTPVGKLEIILGKLTPYFVIGLIQVLMVVTMGVLLFHVPVHGSLVLLFFVSAVFLLAMLMQGLFISVITRQQMLASQVAALSTMLPSMLLSGFIFPIEQMPVPIRIVAQILPAKYFIHALRAVLLRGNGLSLIATDLLAMAGFFLLMLTASVIRFQRTLD